MDANTMDDEVHCLFACSRNADLRAELVRKLGSVGREWDMDTWVWLFFDEPNKEMDEERARERTREAVATFVSKTFTILRGSL